MNKETINEYTELFDAELSNALRKMNQNGRGILFILDHEKRLIGTLTDGDIRRWSIEHSSLPENIEAIMGRKPKYLTDENRGEAISFMQKKRIRAVPIVNASLEVIDILFNVKVYDDVSKRKTDVLNDIPVIIMAGGKGTRLYPYTKILPKPLIPIGDTPIIERIMDRFYEAGAHHFFLTVNYRREMIKSYFSDNHTIYDVEFIDEDSPLGTAGSLKLLQGRVSGTVVVTNCDILIDSDYEKMIIQHKERGNDLTIVSANKRLTIPYGVLNIDDKDRLRSINEKPEMSFEINTGMYIIESRLFDGIPDGCKYDMTDFIGYLISTGNSIGTFTVEEQSFLDMGEFSELKKMEERINVAGV